MESLFSKKYKAFKFDDRVEVGLRFTEEEELNHLRELAIKNSITIPASSNNKRSLCNKLISKFNRGGWICQIPEGPGYWEIHRHDDNKTVYFKFLFKDVIEGLKKLAEELGYTKNPQKEKWDEFKYFDEIKKFSENKK